MWMKLKVRRKIYPRNTEITVKNTEISRFVWSGMLIPTKGNRNIWPPRLIKNPTEVLTTDSMSE